MKKSVDLLSTDIHALATAKSFNQSSQPTARMTLNREIEPEWIELFERAGDSEEDWNCIIKVAQRCTASVYAVTDQFKTGQ